MNNKIILDHIKKHEGFRNFPYDDATGRRVQRGTAIQGQLTIGYGRNLQDNGITQEEADFLFKNDVKNAYNEVKLIFPNIDALPENVQLVLVDMSYNLGRPRLLTFRKFLQAIRDKDYKTASHEMLYNDSLKTIKTRWYSQVGRRAEILSQILKLNKGN